jgi:hypothetical protein
MKSGTDLHEGLHAALAFLAALVVCVSPPHAAQNIINRNVA